MNQFSIIYKHSKRPNNWFKQKPTTPTHAQSKKKALDEQRPEVIHQLCYT
ncbi:hypothetical protein Fmac_025754 [Flemingia macrophylla]|uniref:Uncharacterized protein n=1 Tax=Flemingia macrophylla TaxID=520843 RepID=A0ABD1LT41_9FABA